MKKSNSVQNKNGSWDCVLRAQIFIVGNKRIYVFGR